MKTFGVLATQAIRSGDQGTGLLGFFRERVRFRFAISRRASRTASLHTSKSEQTGPRQTGCWPVGERTPALIIVIQIRPARGLSSPVIGAPRRAIPNHATNVYPGQPAETDGDFKPAQDGRIINGPDAPESLLFTERTWRELLGDRHYRDSHFRPPRRLPSQNFSCTVSV